MFGYDYRIKRDDQGNKVLDISINLEYISKFDDIQIDELECILNDYNPVGLLREIIKSIHCRDY